MYRLWWAPGTAAMAPHAALEEIGTPHELVRVDIAAREHLGDAYRKLNPNGRVPTLANGDFVMSEAAAIILYLADRHPASKLLPGDANARGRAQQWLVHLTNTVQQTFIEFYHPDWYLADVQQATALKESAEARLNGLWQRIDDALAHDGPYLAGATFSAADLYLHMLNRWSRNCRRPAWTWPHIKANIDLVRARPAVRRMMAAQDIAEPY
jgi:glutathione S-transferase